MTRITGLLASAIFLAGPASADVDLRVQSWPISGPIEAFISVTDGNDPVIGLAQTDFVVTLDGTALNTFTLNLPPDQDPTQRKSIAFVINDGRTQSSVADEAVAAFISQMAAGDQAAIIKFHMNPNSPFSGLIEQSFTQIDGATGTQVLLDFLGDHPRDGETGLFDALIRALDQFATPPVPLPNGVKAVFFIHSDTGPFSMRYSESDVVARANEVGAAIFTVAVGAYAERADMTAMFTAFAESTGGKYVAVGNGAQVGEAFLALADSLDEAYRLTIPPTAVTDCNLHMLEITVLGQSTGIPFARCDTTPDHFSFTDETDVETGSLVVSDPVTITGIEGPTTISVIDGEYAIGCGSTFAQDSRFIQPNEVVCVRHTAATAPLTSTSTMLAVGGVSATFTSTTRDIQLPPPPPPPDNGGGGAAGVPELLLVLVWLFAQRRRLHYRWRTYSPGASASGL